MESQWWGTGRDAAECESVSRIIDTIYARMNERHGQIQDYLLLEVSAGSQFNSLSYTHTQKKKSLSTFQVLTQLSSAYQALLAA